LVQNRLTIPRFGAVQKTESLNVATATAIVLSEFCRAKIILMPFKVSNTFLKDFNGT
jgi:hypothetical protein